MTVLPSADFAVVADLLLPPDADTVDGQLRETSTSVPDARWLDLFGVRYRSQIKSATNGCATTISKCFRLTASGRLQSRVGDGGLCAALWGNWVVDRTKVSRVTLSLKQIRIVNRVQWWTNRRQSVSRQMGCASCTVGGASKPDDAATPWTIAGLALVDRRDGAFQPLTPGNHRLIHSGDVKVYENLDVLPRAFMVSGKAVSAETTTERRRLMHGGGEEGGRRRRRPRRRRIRVAPLSLTDHEHHAGAVDGAVDALSTMQQVVISAESSSGGILVSPTPTILVGGRRLTANRRRSSKANGFVPRRYPCRPACTKSCFQCSYVRLAESLRLSALHC